MTRFEPSSAYQPELDIRLTGGRAPGWAQPLVTGRSPNAECWLVVMPRRGGKSWLASGIADARPAGRTCRIDLRTSPASVRRAGLGCLLGGNAKPRLACDVLLVDEPALAPQGRPGVGPEVLAAGLANVRAAGTIPVVFATPLEHSLLLPHLGVDAVKDVVLPPGLDDVEVARMTAREPAWAPETAELVRNVAPAWLRTPFLLELLLHVAEAQPRLRTDVPALLRAAVDEAESRHDYLAQMFGNGLAAGQRAALRIGRWKSVGIESSEPAPPRLISAMRLGDDPVLAHHMPDILRIHHISDLHHGGRLRANVDVKDTTRAGQSIAKLAGAGSPLDSYISHVRQLAAQERAPHLVIVTGDIVNRPINAAGEQAVHWLLSLQAMLADHPDLRAGDPRILLVGGNHDVSWDLCLDPRRESRHQWFANTFHMFTHPDLNVGDFRDRRLFIRFPEAGVRVALLGSAESGGEPVHDEDRKSLEIFRDKFANVIDSDEIRDLVQSFERVDPGVVARDILDRLSPEPGYVTLAALHHPLSPVPAVEVSPYAGIVNAGQVKQALAAVRTALVLHGHTHLAFLAAERLLDSVPGWTLRLAGAPTLASVATDEQNGYNEIFVAREGSGHSIVVRAVRLDGGRWVPQRAVGFRPGEATESSIANLACNDDDENAGRPPLSSSHPLPPSIA